MDRIVCVVRVITVPKGLSTKEIGFMVRTTAAAKEAFSSCHVFSDFVYLYSSDPCSCVPFR